MTNEGVERPAAGRNLDKNEILAPPPPPPPAPSAVTWVLPSPERFDATDTLPDAPERAVDPSADGHAGSEPRSSTRAWYRQPVTLVAAIAVVLVGASGGLAAYNYAQAGGWQDRAVAAESELTRVTARLDDVQDQADDLHAEVEDYKNAAADVAADAAAVAEREAAVKAREDAVAQTEQRIAETMIREGIWTVGVDVQPGTYRTTNEVTSGMCYWSLTTTGSNGDDIQSNDIVTGGFPTVTMNPGQDFTTSGCGTWTKQ